MADENSAKITANTSGNADTFSKERVDAIRGSITVSNEFYNYLIKCDGAYPSLDNYDKDAFEIEGTLLKALKKPCLTDEGEMRIPLGISHICEGALNLFRDNLTADTLLYKGRIKRIIIPEGVETIGSKAFYGLYGLKSVYLPDTLVSIGDFAFFGCAELKEIKIPQGVTGFGVAMFGECRSLSKLSLPFIGYDKEIEVSDKNGKNPHCTVTARGLGVLFSIENEKTDDAEYYYTKCIQCSQGTDSSTGEIVYSTNPLPYQIPKSLKQVIVSGDICYGAFEDFKSLESVTLHGASSIPDNAFKGCVSLRRADIPESVLSIGNDSFTGCDSLEYNQYSNCFYLGNKKNRYEALIYVTENAAKTEIHEKTAVIAPDAFKNGKTFIKTQSPEYDKLPKRVAAVLKKERKAQALTLTFLIFAAVTAVLSAGMIIFNAVCRFEWGTAESYIALAALSAAALLCLAQSFIFMYSKYGVLKLPLPMLSGIGLGLLPTLCIGIGCVTAVGGIIVTVIIGVVLIASAALTLIAFGPKQIYTYQLLLPQIMFAVAIILFALNVRTFPFTL